MLPKNRIPTHPGEILLEEFLKPLNITQIAFAKHIGVSIEEINKIICKKSNISSEIAWLFSQAFETTPEFWLNLQTNYELVKNQSKKKIKKLQKVLY